MTPQDRPKARAMTPEEIRKQANEILKGVDQLIKMGRLDNAVEEIGKAKAIDPRNAYIYAFEERIAVLREESTRKKGAEANRQQVEEIVRKRLEDERRKAEEERKKKDEEARRRLEAERQRTAASTPVSPSVRPPAASGQPVPAAVSEKKKIEEDARRTFTEDFRKAEEQARRKPDEAPRPVAANDAASIYKRVLLLAWADGAITPAEDAQLRAMRTSLGIGDADHQRLEREARFESYAHAFKLAWTSGLSVKERSHVITELRAKFHLSPEDLPRVESRVMAEIGTSVEQQTVLVVEDEDAIRALIVAALESSGFSVRAYVTSDDALKDLKEFEPNLILSDINLDTSSMGGFSFFEKVRQIDRLNRVPFVFLSGLTDEGMVRYGKALGADDYLTKPFTNDMLLDTVKGKLKRFKLLARA